MRREKRPSWIPRRVLLSLRACTLLVLLAGLAPGLCAQAQRPGVEAADASRAPNVLFVLTDDQGWGDLYSHGNSTIDTPVMDRLATEGARFDRFYVSPVCAPTRASLLTGRYYLRTGVADVTRGLETMRASEVTLAEVLQEAGYATGLFGKWHLGSHYPNVPQGQGFGTFFGFLEGHWNNYFSPELLRSRGSAPPDTVQTDGYISDVLTDAAIEFIEAHQDQPFFSYVSYNAPHSPFQVPERYFETYKARGLSDKTAAVYGMVENLDDNMGRLLQALDRLDLREETIVAFMTDNGPNGDRFNGGMRGNKGSVHEGGVRVPFFIRWPGHIPAGQIIRTPAGHIDFLPTIAELTGADPRTKPLDGRSLAPLLLNTSADVAPDWPERNLFTHRGLARNGLGQFPGAVRTERYRLVCYEASCELYDMRLDPAQEHDVAAEYPARAEQMRAAYDAWVEDVTSQGIERPRIPVGYEAAPVVELPATEAYFSDSLAYVYRGYAHEWLTGWTSRADSVWWQLDVTRPGSYAVELVYTTSKDVSAGVPVRAEVAGEGVEGVLKPAGLHAPTVRPERDPEAHRLMKEAFAYEEVGTLYLPEGEQRLVLRLSEPLPQGSVDFYSVRLRRLQNASQAPGGE